MVHLRADNAARVGCGACPAHEYALLIVLGVQFVPLLGAMIATEIALRVVFDENGERKE